MEPQGLRFQPRSRAQGVPGAAADPTKAFSSARSPALTLSLWLCEQRWDRAFASVYLTLSGNNGLALWVSVSAFRSLLLMFE